MSEYTYHSGIQCIVMDDKDHVATALKEIQAGETIQVVRGGEMLSIQALDSIPSGHKIALEQISAGQHVLKYGEAIGAATEGIEKGAHVHVHNIEGIRGRGDQKKEEVQTT
ncbi:UxaA family hydrolase [Bacillaceae bacterium SIJ1]|uniref:UxaA family hydrolase n=1 Tax=Litoribacterium kuwaitense TaxID=1398745 RepID=UPI0013EA9AAB|nr:UxaA family hydrolase [Litoribacterium kuwaitense]NGP45447.1 UxaA family hydrolase [Litoribacterium kuwaitense]